jgi:hypothetical protein
VRRTTSIEPQLGAPGHEQEIFASGRDLLTRTDGTTLVVDQVRLRATVDATGTLTSIEADPPEPRLRGLVGGHVSRRLRARLDELLPDQGEAATVLHQLLDDFPMAALISSYGAMRDRDDDWTMPTESAERMTDLCAGWAAGATMLDALDRTGIFPIPIGPPAPDLTSSDPLAWHDLAPMAPRSVRRRRRLDLIDGDPLTLDVHFRDSHLGADGLEDVLHEYTLAVTLDARLTVLTSDAAVRVLPWPECPGALGSAARIVGQPVTALRDLVTVDFKGTSTCTHLNDVLRSVVGATALASALVS